MTDFERGYRQGQADYFRWVKTFSGGKPNYVIPPETPAMIGLTQGQAREVAHAVVHLGLQVRELQHLSATRAEIDLMREKMLDIMETAFNGVMSTVKDVGDD